MFFAFHDAAWSFMFSKKYLWGLQEQLDLYWEQIIQGNTLMFVGLAS